MLVKNKLKNLLYNSITMRDKLREKYHNEREELCKKIIEILDLNENSEFILYDLDQNIDKQQRLLELKTEIQKYFECSTISTFKPNFSTKRPYLNLVRGILRKQGYIIEGSDHQIKFENGLYKRTMKYKIFRIHEI